MISISLSQAILSKKKYSGAHSRVATLIQPSFQKKKKKKKKKMETSIGKADYLWSG